MLNWFDLWIKECWPTNMSLVAVAATVEVVVVVLHRYVVVEVVLLLAFGLK